MRGEMRWRTQRRLARARTNGAATHVEGAHAACGGAGGVRGLERRRPPPYNGGHLPSDPCSELLAAKS